MPLNLGAFCPRPPWGPREKIPPEVQQLSKEGSTVYTVPSDFGKKEHLIRTMPDVRGNLPATVKLKVTKQPNFCLVTSQV